MRIFNLIKQGINVLANPAKEFTLLQKKTLEKTVSDYLTLLLLSAIVAAIFNIAYSVVRAFYLDVFYKIDIDYLVILNYSLTGSFAIAFSYILIGTMVIFLVSAILNIFLKKIKYTELLKIILYSLYPFLLFGWITFLAFSMLAWSIFLFILGVRYFKSSKIKTSSIKFRD